MLTVISTKNRGRRLHPGQVTLIKRLIFGIFVTASQSNEGVSKTYLQIALNSINVKL